MIKKLLILSLFLMVSLNAQAQLASHVIVVSIDGLRADAILASAEKDLPTFYSLIQDGTSTLNARTDVDFTNTLPNHTSMLTSRPVSGPKGHHYTHNGMPKVSLHENKGQYVYSVFDVVKKASLKTALFASKSKFKLYTLSYQKQGAEKIDYSFLPDKKEYIRRVDQKILKNFTKTLKEERPQFSFVHFAGADKMGHDYGWMSKTYLHELKFQDAYLKRIIKAIKSDPHLAINTIMIVTSDHGGIDRGHQDNKNSSNYTIPFFIWGSHVAKGRDLYELNFKTRKDPDKDQVAYDSPNQPIRNSDIGNLVCKILGLDPIPGSSVGRSFDLKIR